MKELTLIPIIIIILLFIFRHQVSHIIESIQSRINRKIQKITYGASHKMLYSY